MGACIFLLFLLAKRPTKSVAGVPVGAVAPSRPALRSRGKCLSNLPDEPLGGPIPRHLEPQQLQTTAQRSASERPTYRLRRSPPRDFAEMSFRSATAASKVAPNISTPSTGPPQSSALEARHGSGTHPTAGFPAHSLDQITQITIDLRPPCPISRFPTPEDFETARCHQDSLRADLPGPR